MLCNLPLRCSDYHFAKVGLFVHLLNSISEATITLRPCTTLGLACTSMSFTLGPERVDELLLRSRRVAAAPNSGVPAKVTDMARAQVMALKALGTRRVALVTPYIGEFVFLQGHSAIIAVVLLLVLRGPVGGERAIPRGAR